MPIRRNTGHTKLRTDYQLSFQSLEQSNMCIQNKNIICNVNALYFQRILFRIKLMFKFKKKNVSNYYQIYFPSRDYNIAANTILFNYINSTIVMISHQN